MVLGALSVKCSKTDFVHLAEFENPLLQRLGKKSWRGLGNHGRIAQEPAFHSLGLARPETPGTVRVKSAETGSGSSISM